MGAADPVHLGLSEWADAGWPHKFPDRLVKTLMFIHPRVVIVKDAFPEYRFCLSKPEEKMKGHD